MKIFNQPANDNQHEIDTRKSKMKRDLLNVAVTREQEEMLETWWRNYMMQFGVDFSIDKKNMERMSAEEVQQFMGWSVEKATKQMCAAIIDQQMIIQEQYVPRIQTSINEYPWADKEKRYRVNLVVARLL